MAQMYPKNMRPYEKSSKEDLMFRALESLSDDYFVFHSVNFDNFGKRNPEDVFQAFHQHQADFIIFHKDKGILVIEGKAGTIKFENGNCIQINGKDKTERTITPYQQAANIKFDILNCFDKEQIPGLKRHCKLQHAVWFADLSKNDFLKQSAGLEMNAYRTLTFEDIKNTDNLIKDIDKLFSIPDEFEEEYYKKIKKDNPRYSKMTDDEFFKAVYKNPTNLTDENFEKIKDKIFVPLLVLAGSESTNIQSEDMRLDYLLYEQKLLLNYLDEQRSAIINGAAGTGKTFIACEKARRHSKDEEKVLFLCYNKKLRNKLYEIYKNDEDMANVDFYTIDKLSYDYCKEINYKKLAEKIGNMYDEFPYQHVIIDEGQDFGLKFNDDNSYDNTICNVIDALKNTVLLDETKNNSFYLFYDKNQMIQCKSIPPYIQDADCKLTLYTNCRNTANIAKTSFKLINKKNKVLKNNIDSKKPIMYNSLSKEQQIKDIESILQEYIDKEKVKEEQITILTVKTIKNKKKYLDSILSDSPNLKEIDKDEYSYCYKGKRFEFTTCRKFKGLESNIVILIDVTAESFSSEMNQSIIYVGATRAKNRLFVVSNIKDDEWKQIDEKMNFEIRKPATAFGTFKNNLDIDIVKR